MGAKMAEAQTLKIGFVADWEYGSQRKYDHKSPSKAKKYLKRAVNYYNSIYKPDLAIGGGDYILSRKISKKKAKKQLKEVTKIFNGVNAPKMYCIGNHDLFDLKKPEAMGILGLEYNYNSKDIGGVRVITLDTNEDDSDGAAGRVSQAQLDWLEKQLETELPVIVFSHHSPVLTPNGKKFRMNLYQPEQLMSVLEKNGNVVAMFSGHRNVNYMTEVNGISYVIINNLGDTKALGSFAKINIETSEDNQVTVHVEQLGKKPTSYDFSKILKSN
jgi:hypothetical protein